MNQLASLFFSLSLLALSASAHAQNLSAYLTTFNVDPKATELSNIESGSIRVNLDTQIVRLTLYPRYHCADGMFCATVMPTPIVVELPIVSVATDDCNNTVYHAQGDLRSRAHLQKLTVTDYTQNTCPTYAPLAPTYVTYETIGTKMDPIDTFSTFEANRLASGLRK